MFYTSEGKTYTADARFIDDRGTREPITSIADRILECHQHIGHIEALTRNIMFNLYGSVEEPQGLEQGPQCFEEAVMMIGERLSKIALNLERIEMKVGSYNV